VLDKLLGPLARRWPWIGTALAVQKRFGEVRGGYLASAVTLNIFLSLFPLLLVTIAVVGFVTSSRTDLPEQVISNLGLTGQSATTVNHVLLDAANTKKAASVVGLLGLLWSGLGVVGAIEFALDATWQFTGRSIKDKARGLGWAVGALLILGGSIALTTGFELFVRGRVLDVLTALIAIVINFIFWMWTFWVLSYQRVDWRGYVPGAVMAAVGLEIIKQLATLLPQLFQGSSALYGSLGIVFGILTTLLFFGRLLVYSSALNVVKWEAKQGTVTIEVDVPKIPGEVPLTADRSGAVETVEP
jgi:membrane protein